MERGNLIAFHRKRLGLTQTELGEMVNVTAQAVSKWEKGISEPDLSTVQKLCKIFDIDSKEFFTEEEPAKEKTAPQEETAAPAEEAANAAPATPVVVAVPAPAANAAPDAPEQKVETKFIVGYCERCKRPIEQGEEYEVEHRGKGAGVTYLYCEKCDRNRKHQSANSEVSSQRKKFLISMGVGGAVGAVLALIFIILAIVKGDGLYCLGLVLAVCAFTFTTQLFWDGVVVDFMDFFIHSFRMPGVIFTLDLDGIIWFITVKLLLMILSGLLSVLLFIVGSLFTLFASALIFPFALVKNRAEFAKAKKTLKSYEVK